MTQKYKRILSLTILLLTFPAVSLAAVTGPKTLKGVVTKITYSQLNFSVNTGAIYSVDIANAQLLRKNGSPMKFSEFMVGDKIEVKGNIWSDNSISAVSIRDLSLYPRNGTFVGKITNINPANFSFTIQSALPTVRTVYTDTLTTYKKNGGSSSFKDLQLGMSVSVKGVWERKDSLVFAKEVKATSRLVNIYFRGSLSIRGDQSFTVLGENKAIYGLDISEATLQDRNGRPLHWSQFNVGDNLRVWGKHVSGTVQIKATKIKNTSYPR